MFFATAQRDTFGNALSSVEIVDNRRFVVPLIRYGLIDLHIRINRTKVGLRVFYGLGKALGSIL